MSSVLDHACVLAAFGAASGIASLLARFGLFVWPGPSRSDVAGWPAPYAVLLAASLLVWTAASTYTGIYRQTGIEWSFRRLRRLWQTVILWAAMTTAGIFLFKLNIVSRQFGLFFFAVAAVLVTLRKFGEVVLSRRLDGANPSGRVIVTGTRQERRAVALALAHSPDKRYRGLEELDPENLEASDHVQAEHCAGGGSATSGHAFVITAGLDGATAERVILHLLRHRWCVNVVPALVDTRLFRYHLDDLGGAPVISLEAGHLAPTDAALKRAVDVIGSAILLLGFALPLALIALAIKLTSRGPVLFSQLRVGKDGARFRMYKFRSMRADAAELLARTPELYAKYVANNFKLPKDDDFRVTRLGRFLRATSLDELPQLLNVLKGEMSLVGPRPIVPEELARYGEFADLLLSVKPGITGHWQTSGRSRIAEYSKRVLLDMEYIRDQSLRTDLEILVRTVGAVARREGSY